MMDYLLRMGFLSIPRLVFELWIFMTTMASNSEEDLSCPICREVFREPVLLSCSHNFCKLCLRRWWKEKPSKECPICRKRSLNRDPPSNLALKNLCESFVKKRRLDSAEAQCSVHSEKLKLFCLDHQQPVCVVCRDSKAHRDHRFSPIEEAAQDLKEELQKSLQPFKNKLRKIKEDKKSFNKSAGIIKDQTCRTEKQIQEQFKKLHQFLLEEEETRMKALREEGEQKTQRMKGKMESVSREIEALSETITATEEQLRAADVSFLLKYKAAVDRVQHRPLLEEQQLGPGDLIDQAKHLGNLAFNIWSNMKRLVQYTPVVLDPNTAQRAELSDCLISLIPEEKQRRTSEVRSTIVLGSEGFDSGAHTWDVEVEENDDWALGVITEVGFAYFDSDSSNNDDFDYDFVDYDDVSGDEEEQDMERWGISFSEGKYAAGVFSDKSEISPKLNSNPRRIRVHVDCDKHEVTFSDADTNTVIHSFSQIHQKKLFPLFYTDSKCPIRILPQEISLSIL